MSELYYEYCASCSGDLDTGWECTDCGRDWSGVVNAKEFKSTPDLFDEVKSPPDLFDDVAWWHFWNPLSGHAGGLLMGLVLSPFVILAFVLYEFSR